MCSTKIIKYMLIPAISLPYGQRKSFEPLGEIRNLNKSFCHTFGNNMKGQGIYILINNTNNLIQQHCAQNNTLGAQGFVKDNGSQ